MTNQEILLKLRRLHTLLVLEKRSNNLALAIRRAIEVIADWKVEATQMIKQTPINTLFVGYGPKFIRIFKELIDTGNIHMIDQLQPQYDPFFCFLCEVPRIGETMARRMFFEKSIRSMDDLRIAYTNNVLQRIPAFGDARLKSVERVLWNSQVHPSTVSQPNDLSSAQSNTPTHANWPSMQLDLFDDAIDQDPLNAMYNDDNLSDVFDDFDPTYASQKSRTQTSMAATPSRVQALNSMRMPSNPSMAQTLNPPTQKQNFSAPRPSQTMLQTSRPEYAKARVPNADSVQAELNAFIQRDLTAHSITPTPKENPLDSLQADCVYAKQIKATRIESNAIYARHVRARCIELDQKQIKIQTQQNEDPVNDDRICAKCIRANTIHADLIEVDTLCVQIIDAHISSLTTQR